MNKDRFIKVYSQGSVNISEIWIDRETGVNYLFHAYSDAGGLTPLIDKDGKPIVSEEYIESKAGFQVQEKI